MVKVKGYIWINGEPMRLREDITLENEDEFKELLENKEYYLYTVIDCEEEEYESGDIIWQFTHCLIYMEILNC